MNSIIFSSFQLHVCLLCVSWILTFQIPPSSSYDLFTNCSNNFNCGEITDVGFPFWGDTRPEYCGYPAMKMYCDGNITTIDIMEVKYRVLEFYKDSQTIKIARNDYENGLCPTNFVNTTIDYNLFDLVSGYQNISLVYCSKPIQGLAGQFPCPQFNFNFIRSGAVGPELCNASVVIPVTLGSYSSLVNSAEISKAIKDGFEVKWKEDSEWCRACQDSKGVCGYDLILNHTTCFCSGYPAGYDYCPTMNGGPPATISGGNKLSKSHLAIGLSVGVAAILGICVGCWILYVTRRKKRYLLRLKSKNHSSPHSSEDIIRTTPSTFVSQSIPSYPYSRSDLEKGSSYFGAQVFTYTELEEATSKFDRSRELGDGGYGTVYFGKLRDGRAVAVKRLYENNFRRVEQFMNEVEILTQLQHPNLVKLYGCTSRHSRELLLVYEYIPNGTVADHLHGKLANSGLLSWSIRLRIAIETANALAYLHRKEIIHRDVKTNNILLDENFRVKVADFGLSRLFPTDVTHVSTAPQGTPGYVDPEYFQCYQLTGKSDVYSFGVVLVELISSLQAVDMNRKRNDINLFNMAIDRIQNQTLHELVDPILGFERDYRVRGVITSIAELAFRCLQQDRDLRPSMDEVLEALRGFEKEDFGVRNAEVLDIGSDDVRLLSNMSSPFSP